MGSKAWILEVALRVSTIGCLFFCFLSYGLLETFSGFKNLVIVVLILSATTEVWSYATDFFDLVREKTVF